MTFCLGLHDHDQVVTRCNCLALNVLTVFTAN